MSGGNGSKKRFWSRRLTFEARSGIIVLSLLAVFASIIRFISPTDKEVQAQEGKVAQIASEWVAVMGLVAVKSNCRKAFGGEYRCTVSVKKTDSIELIPLTCFKGDLCELTVEKL